MSIKELVTLMRKLSMQLDALSNKLDSSSSGVTDIHIRLHRWAAAEYHANGRQPLHERRIRAKLLQAGTEPEYLDSMVEFMVLNGLLALVTGVYPNRLYLPCPVKIVEQGA